MKLPKDVVYNESDKQAVKNLVMPLRLQGNEPLIHPSLAMSITKYAFLLAQNPNFQPFTMKIYLMKQKYAEMHSLINLDIHKEWLKKINVHAATQGNSPESEKLKEALHKLMDDIGVYAVRKKSANWESKTIRNEMCV